MNEIQKTDQLIYHGYAGAFASFFEAADPNAFKLTSEDQVAVPDFHETDLQWVIESDGFVIGHTDMLRCRCDFWRSVADKVPL